MKFRASLFYFTGVNFNFYYLYLSLSYRPISDPRLPRGQGPELLYFCNHMYVKLRQFNPNLNKKIAPKILIYQHRWTNLNNPHTSTEVENPPESSVAVTTKEYTWGCLRSSKSSSLASFTMPDVGPMLKVPAP